MILKNNLTMKHLLFLFAISTLILGSCKEDDPKPTETDFDYHAHIHAPNMDDKHVDDTIHIEIEFESHTGEPVHHVNIKIVSLDGNTEVYNMPSEAHVHATSGAYTFEDDFKLSNDNGVVEHTDWILEAKVWGDGEGLGEVIEKVQFHVHP